MTEVHVFRAGSAIAGVFDKHAKAMAAALDHRKLLGGKWTEHSVPGRMTRGWSRADGAAVSITTHTVQ